MKRLFLALTAALALCAAGVAVAQSHGSGAWHGGGSHGGGSGHGGGWHGSGSHGSGWHGSGWHHGGWRGGSHFGLFVGFPGYYWPGYYPYSYYYPSYYTYPYYPAYYYPATPVYDDSAPSTYIEQDSGGVTQQSAPRQGQYSYYCTDPAGYYPQVQSCATGWLRVVPDAGPAPRSR